MDTYGRGQDICLIIQESLANAKVSAWQQCVYEGPLPILKSVSHVTAKIYSLKQNPETQYKSEINLGIYRKLM